jgi:hypothetical protein
MRKDEQLSPFESSRRDQKRVSRASLSAVEKAGTEAALNRCRALAQRIECELRNRRSEHFADLASLAEFQAALERAASVLERKSRRSAQTSEPEA